MENRLSLFSFHLWSLLLCSRTVIVWTMQMVLLNQICMAKASCFVSTALQQTWLLDLDFLEKNIIYNCNFELFCFVFSPLNWSKANSINDIKPGKSGKEVIGLKITHKSGQHLWNHFLKQFRKCLYRHLAVKE